MGLTDRLRNVVNLADTKQKPKLDTESGVSAAGIDLNEDNVVKNPQDLSIQDFRKMKNNDGTISAIYNILTLPIKANSYELQGDDTAEKKLVEENLLNKPQQGGMQIPLDHIIGDMLRAVQDGFRGYEKVFTLNDQGQIVYKKIAARDSTQLHIKATPAGEFDGFEQRVWIDLEEKIFKIPANRSFLFTLNKEVNYLYGESMFKAAYYHYDKKHKYYYLQYLQDQAAAIPPRKLKIVGNPDSNAIAAAERAADKFGIRQRITLTKDFDLEEYKTQPQDLQNRISHHNMQMALSVLVQFLLLGAEGRGGSFSLSKDHSEILMLVLNGLTQQIQDHINAFIIPDLVDYNFASGEYPEFKYTDMTDRNQDLLESAFTEILKKGNMTPEVANAIVQEVATGLGLDMDEIEAAKEEEAAKEGDETDKSKKKDDTELAEDERVPEQYRYHRALTKAETKVNLAELESKMDTFEAQFAREARDVMDKLKDDLTRQVTKVMTMDSMKGIGKLKFNDLAQYRKLLQDTTMQSYLYGKQSAADELDAKIPATPKDTKTFIKENAQAVAEKQANDLIFIAKSEVTKQLRKTNLSEVELGLSDVVAAITAAFATYYDNKILVGGSAAVSMGLNKGRDDVFMSNQDRITRYQFSALLDSRTCQCCMQLDGSVVGEAEYRTSPFTPPVHLHCRCIWVAIESDEVDPPEITGMNPAPACATTAHLSEQTQQPDYDKGVSDRMDTLFGEIDHIKREVKTANTRNDRIQAKLDELEL